MATIAGGELNHAAPVAFVHALELLAAADRPVHRIGLDTEHLLDLLQQLERIARFAVHFIDKGKDGDMPQHTHLKQLYGLFFHTLGRVDHHHGGIRRHQCAVGILRKILVTGGVQNVDTMTGIFKLHRRRGDRNTSLFFDLHPVGYRMLGGFFAFYRTGGGDCPSVQQQLFGQGGLTRVGVRYDRKCASAVDFLL